MSEKGKSNQINIELSPEQAEGIYSNLAIIAHSQAEFIIDFTRILPGSPNAKVHARIVMTPVHAKMFNQALAENIAKYESQNGEIKSQNVNDQMGFIPNNPKIN